MTGTLTDISTKSKVMRELGLRPGMNCSGRDLSSLDLVEADLSGVNFNRANLASANLDGALLIGASFVCPVIERTTMRGAVASRAYAHAMAAVSSDWSGIRFDHSPDTTGALFHGVKLANADLQASNFAGTTFYQCDLTGANLTDAVLDHAVFNECILNGARFLRAKMEGCTISRCSGRLVDLSTAIAPGLRIISLTGRAGGWLFVGAKMRGATLQNTDLFGAKFTGADLCNATIADCGLDRSWFHTASLRGARIQGCVGHDADFHGADLSGSSIADSSLDHPCFDDTKMENAFVLNSAMYGGSFENAAGRGLTFRDCSLEEANFRNAYLYRACFTGDPVTGMILDRGDFTGANLIQATIAASAREAILKDARAAYARLNQTDLTGALLDGFKPYKASVVKTIWPDKEPSEVLVAPSSSKEIGST